MISNLKPEASPDESSPVLKDEETTGSSLDASAPNAAARSAVATTSVSKAVNEDTKNMPALADRRVSIRAEDLGDTEDPRELTRNRHQQDAEHEQYLQDYGGANTQAGRLLRRDGQQPAPTSRQNASEDGVPGVLLEPDQPSGTSSNRLRSHPVDHATGCYWMLLLDSMDAAIFLVGFLGLCGWVGGCGWVGIHLLYSTGVGSSKFPTRSCC